MADIPETNSHNFIESLTELKPAAKELLIDYAGVPESEALQHVHKLRDKAWETCPYGCVGVFAFTWPGISRVYVYQQVLDRVKSGDKLLDLGCGFGQNIRKLVYDGAPSENITGADISQAMVDCGFEYFRDRDRLKTKFFIGDVFDEDAPAYKDVAGHFDLVYASMFYHLWDWDGQVKAFIQTIKLLKPVPGSMIFGFQLGATPAGEVQRKRAGKESLKQMYTYQHDEESWRAMWREIETKTSTKWDVDVKGIVTPEIEERRGIVPTREGSSIIGVVFTMTRL
ncbi:uncharacterized protein PV09_08385 [Verruconis gallopava]|uniref:Methyltransferase domain-containing protein n=1 Tax=Verruconis gallopava TaxID=253628 RepID=A0A0D2A0A4_9PEZI|nr:uncharacterized protein PV09_08385 [Verruconis gallopava]KIW00033.1 hypothetical protein PV09_08385 [Verruconis gallopava]